jgi:raffinose/stachyose/melibiose transport system substrate-binding protein
MKRKLTREAVVALAAAALTLTACSPDAETPTTTDANTTVSITFMHRYPEDEYAPWFQKMADTYTKEHPNVTIKVEAVGNQNYREQLQLLTGQNDTPDIFWATPGNLTNEFVKAGLAHELTEALAQDGWKDSLDQQALAGYSVAGKYYGIPLQSNYKFLAYNPNMFSQAGVSVPKTLEDLLTACDTLKAKGVTPIGFGKAEGWPAMHYMTVLNGYYVPTATLTADYSKVDAPADWNDPGYKLALDAFLDIQKRCFEPGSQTGKFDAGRASFLSGKAAMYAGSFGEIKLISDQTDAAAFPQPWGIANMPAPTGAGGDPNSIAGAGNGIVVKEGPNAGVATDFLRFMTNQANAESFHVETGFVSAVTAANTPDNTITQTQEFLTTIVPTATSVNMWLDNALSSKVMAAYQAAMEGLLGGQLTSAQVLETLRTTQP